MTDNEDAVVVYAGGECKALGNGRVGGYCVLFGDETTPDKSETKDYFDAKTNFGPHHTSLAFYHHGKDGSLKKAVLDEDATLKPDDVGVWVEAQLDLADKYQRAIYGLVERKALGWSTGTAPHLVEREAKANGVHRIARWPLGLDCSLTPTPAEPRASAVALKSLPAGPSLDELVKDLPEETKQAEEPADKQPEETKQAEEPAGDETKDLDLNQTASLVQEAVRKMINGTTDYGPDKPWIDTYVFATYVIYRKPDAGCFRRSYVLDGGKVVLGETETAVEQTWQPLKAVELPPTLGSLGELTMEEHSQSVLAAVTGWQDRMSAIKALRAEKAGRVLSQMNRDRMAAMLEQMRQAAEAMHAMLEETAPPTRDDDDEGTSTKKALDELRRAVLLTEISLPEYV